MGRGLQLTTTLGHGLKAIDLDLLPQAYAAAVHFWGYPIFLIIVVGTWRSHQRDRERTAVALALASARRDRARGGAMATMPAIRQPSSTRSRSPR